MPLTFSNMERWNLYGAVFLDLSKTFDTVDYSILLAKLSSLGLNPNVVQWFQSYLIHRKQPTSGGKEISNPLPVTYGVPQDSILGPLRFLVYVYDLPTALNDCSVFLYADNTVLYRYSSNIKDLENALNEWSVENSYEAESKQAYTQHREDPSPCLSAEVANCVLLLLYLSQYLTKKLRALDTLGTWV